MRRARCCGIATIAVCALAERNCCGFQAPIVPQFIVVCSQPAAIRRPASRVEEGLKLCELAAARGSPGGREGRFDVRVERAGKLTLYSRRDEENFEVRSGKLVVVAFLYCMYLLSVRLPSCLYLAR